MRLIGAPLRLSGLSMAFDLAPQAPRAVDPPA
jgi:hypothetical protein